VKYSLAYKPSAIKELLRLPKQYAFKVRAAINKLTDNPRPPHCKKLEGSDNEYRIRVGKYRVVYTIADDVLTVVVIKIAHRKEAYR
jgi:mRNA interferase RelE/StbE